ncbi:MAG: hypothetical protein HOP09_12545 [Hyphomicrobium sp.]|nr:hypothetical protein [Hyphomicrobium sp.]
MPTARPKTKTTKTTKADVAAAVLRIITRAKAKTDAPALGDHPDTLDIIHRAMNSAARKAVVENDRLGIPTPGTDKDGKITMRQPKKRGRTVGAG